MKTKLSIIIAFISLNLCNCTLGNSSTSNTYLSAIEFSAEIKKQKSLQLIDVRTPEEFAKGHLENAVNIDWNETDFGKLIEKFNKDTAVFIYCLSGGRSAAAADYLRNNGFKKVIELDGGIMKWRGANLPETSMDSNQSKGMSLAEYEKLLVSEKLVLVDFYADWCGPCKKMKPFLEEIKNEYSQEVTIIRINADDNQALCKQLKIDALPVLSIYKNEQKKWHHLGFIDKVGLLAELKKNI